MASFQRMSSALIVAALALVVSAGSVSAQDAQARKGKELWLKRGCAGCHGIGKKMAGPDVAGVSQRRSREWLNRWLKDTSGMLASDSTAQAMLVEWHGMKMPTQKLSDQEIDALIAYIDSESARLRAKS